MDNVIIILEILIGIFSCYIIYYLRQKGKNQANKEDLKDLTEIVENVKKENNEDLEVLKTRLSLLTDRQQTIFNEEKDAIVIFFSSLNKWIWDSLDIQLNEFNHTNSSELSIIIIKMRETYNSVNVTFSKVQLLVPDGDLIKTGHETISETLKLHHFIESLALKLKRNLSWEKVLVEQIGSGKVDFQKISEDTKSFYLTQSRDQENEREGIFKEYISKHQFYFNPAIEKVNKFKSLAQKYLRQ